MFAARYLIDTNILLRLFVIKDQDSILCQRAVSILRHRNVPLHFTLQNASEFWNRCTRPLENHGLGMEPAEVSHALRVLLSQCSPVADTDAVFQEWMRLVTQFHVRGVKVHDAKLVAAMHAHQIPAILTLNDRDFRRFESIVVVRPETIVE